MPTKVWEARLTRFPCRTGPVEQPTSLSETRSSDFVFPGERRGKPLSNMAMLMLLRRMKTTNPTVHGFRSSFRDWCGDETTFPREVAEAALAHKVGNEVEKSLPSLRCTREAAEAHASLVRLLLSAEGDNVVRLKR